MKGATHEIGDPWGLVDETQTKQTGFSSILVTGPQLTLSSEPVVRSAFAG